MPSLTLLRVLCAATLAAPAIARQCDEYERIPSPNAAGEANVLRGAAARSSNDVWVVGSYRTGGLTLPMSMRWNGAAWTVTPMPAPSAVFSPPATSLYDVHAFSANNAWAVGSNPGVESAAIETLVYRWNGSAWSIVPSPAGSAGVYGSAFYCVDGVAPDDFWAAGYINIFGPGAAALVAHWNGSGWEQHLFDVISPRINGVKDLHVRAQDDIYALEAVGLNAPTSPHRVFHWDGSDWSEATTRIDPLQYAAAEAIHALGPDDIWVSSVRESTFALVMLHWDGSAWTELPSPIFASAIFGDDPNNLLAVGYNAVMRWDGATWSVVDAIAGTPDAHCFGADIDPDGVIWGAGSTQPGPAAETFVTRFGACDGGCEGDVNGDDSVDFADLNLLLGQYNQQAEPGTLAGDLNGDGIVDFADLNVVLGRYGQPC